MSKEDGDSKKIYIGIVFAAVLIIIIWYNTPNIVPWFISEDGGKIGETGDMFGVVNTLFSGLALAFIIGTLWMQKEELEAQREELRDTREVFEEQKGIMQRQAFETSFFALLAHFERQRERPDYM